MLIEKLIDWNEPNREGCIVSDRITKEGFKVGYMDEDNPDSGWRFLAGDEDEAYMNDSSNHHIFSINTICNYILYSCRNRKCLYTNWK